MMGAAGLLTEQKQRARYATFVRSFVRERSRWKYDDFARIAGELKERQSEPAIDTSGWKIKRDGPTEKHATFNASDLVAIAVKSPDASPDESPNKSPSLERLGRVSRPSAASSFDAA